MSGLRRFARQGAVVLLLSAAVAVVGRSADRSDKPDKPDKPSRADKIERRRERAMAAAAQDAPASLPLPMLKPRAAASPAPAENGAVALAPDAKFNQFRPILERNIFNPARVARVRPDADEKPVHVDTLAFVGTMDNGAGPLAFFDSPATALRKAVRTGETVGEFKIQRITPNTVDLVRDGKPFTLQVGQQLRRTENGPWGVGGSESAAPAAPVESSAPAATSASETPTSSLPPNAAEVLRRLIEQRQKQLKQ